MLANINGRRAELEARVLAAALKQSVERGDRNGALLAYKHLGLLMRQIIDDTSAGQQATTSQHIPAIQVNPVPMQPSAEAPAPAPSVPPAEALKNVPPVSP